jgi:integrase
MMREPRRFDTAMFHVKHLREAFGFDRAIIITADRFASYQASRLEAGASVATVNRETACMSRMLKLAVEKKRLASKPTLKLVEGENVRQGFIAPEDFDAVLPHLPLYLQGLVEFLYRTGWRRKEGQTLLWADVDQRGGIIRLRIENSKTKEPRVYPLAGRVLELIQEAQQRRRLDCPFVFHHAGKQIKSFRKAWRNACDTAGLGHVVPHDMKRSAARNLSRAGVRAEVAMKMIGHKTPSMWRRYRIVDEGCRIPE